LLLNISDNLCSFLLQDQQVQWQDALKQLQDSSNNSSSSAAGISTAQLTQQLQDLYQQLLALPDPLPALKNAAALTAKTQGGPTLTCAHNRNIVLEGCLS
jgi:hypothetical protein